MKILIVDDDNLSRESVADFISEQLLHSVHQASSARDALAVAYNNDYDIILTDLKMPGINGLELLRELKSMKPQCKVIIFTGFGDMETALDAFREGATDYLLKPINIEKLAQQIAALEIQINESYLVNNSVSKGDDKLSSNMVAAKGITNNQVTGSFNANVGVFSPEMKEIMNLCAVYHSNPNVPVLIQGETGTGKEIIARQIHFANNQSSNLPFVALNCSAISPGLFESELFGYEEGAFTGARKSGSAGKLEQAQGGTLFLDEIGDMPLDMQPKLLRVIQEKELNRVGGSQTIKLNVRFIFATNRDLRQMAEEGTFRSDLFFRINTGHIYLPPLRDRKKEIIPFALYFIEKYSQKLQKKFRFIETGARSLLENYTWPGNVRELENVVERIILLHDDEYIRDFHLSFMANTAGQSLLAGGCIISPGKFVLPESSLALIDLEREIVYKAMIKFNNNKSKVAAYLGITRSALRKFIKD